MSITLTNYKNRIQVVTPDYQYQLRKHNVSVSANLNNNELTIWFGRELIEVLAYESITSPVSQNLTELTNLVANWLNDIQPCFYTPITRLEVQELNLETDVYSDWRLSAVKYGASSSTIEAIWATNLDEFSFLNSAQTLKISGNGQDIYPNGSGAQQVLIAGLDENYDPISEIINLNGVIDFNTSNQYLRVNNLEVISAGSLNKNSGSVVIDTLSGDLLTGIIAGDNQALIALYTVPRNHTLIITELELTYSVPGFNLSSGEIYLFQIDEINRVPVAKSFNFVVGPCIIKFPTAIVIPEKNDVYLALRSNTGFSSAHVLVNASGYVIQKN